MIPIRTLASAMLAAFGAIGGRSAAAPATPTFNDATVSLAERACRGLDGLTSSFASMARSRSSTSRS